MSINIEELVEKYVKLRDKKAEYKAEYEAKVGKIEELLDRVEGVLLKHFQETGVESVRTGAGTAYKSSRTSATVADWESFFAFVQDSDSYHMLERRCSKKAVEEYKQAHDDLPPGVNWSEEVTVGIRRGK